MSRFGAAQARGGVTFAIILALALLALALCPQGTLAGLTGGFNTFDVSVSKSGTGQGAVTSSPGGIWCGADCSSNFAIGTSVALTAVASKGSRFSTWSGACSGDGACSVSAPSDGLPVSVEAIFEAIAPPPKPTIKRIGKATFRSLKVRIGCGPGSFPSPCQLKLSILLKQNGKTISTCCKATYDVKANVSAVIPSFSPAVGEATRTVNLMAGRVGRGLRAMLAKHQNEARRKSRMVVIQLQNAIDSGTVSRMAIKEQGIPVRK
ncbi:MAG: hypothetical protein WD181_06485 [Solirubrobacterales bacterium]